MYVAFVVLGIYRYLFI